MKKFKTESQRVLDLMINSIYTHKEIFLRELISNASDAIDKLYYRARKDELSGLSREDFCITVTPDPERRTLTIADNGIGMSAEELDNNLGVIARSGSLAFKNSVDADADVDVIGQFGVGFYSAFMVADRVEVISRAYGSDGGARWYSTGSTGYTVDPCEKAETGTTIVLHLKPDDEDEQYSRFLQLYTLEDLIRRYSDYVRYPILLPREKEDDACDCGHDHEHEHDHDHDHEPEQAAQAEKPTEGAHAGYRRVNSMVPLWKRNKNEVKKEEYDSFYKDKFGDYNAPLRAIHVAAEGAVDYRALLFLPSKAPYNYYTRQYEKGLQLYSRGVLITDKCAELVPDCFSFVRGVVDADLNLNISRETIQHNRHLTLIANGLEKKIKSELEKMLADERETYEAFYDEFGLQLKYGIYDNWGAKRDLLQDLVLFRSLKSKKYVTLAEYVEAMPQEQGFIYYATGKSVDAIAALPQTERVSALGYDVLCLTDDVDEFAIRFLGTYREKEFKSVSSSDIGVQEEVIEDPKLTDFIKEALGDKVSAVKAGTRLKRHAVCFTTEGELSIEMEKVLNQMPGNKGGVKANKVLELNANHPLYAKMKELLETDPDRLKRIAEVLYASAQLIEGIPPEDPAAVAALVSDLLA